VVWPREGGGDGEVRPDARKTVAIRAIRAVAVEVNGQGDALERGGGDEVICVAGGGLTVAAASGGASGGGDGKTEKKKTDTR
jgi:hypothetical protein